ncbi:MAG: hypothetical protein KGV50_03720 [Gammaproteobacteria bacterium]|nr:hypothetical protein [Gammaproteobacteria bacterium]
MTAGIDLKIKKLIDDKAKADNPNACFCLNVVSEYIKQLNNHISGNITLTRQQIERRLNTLLGYFTITLKLPLDKDLKLSRAVKYNELDDSNPCYNEVSRLSYIPQSSGITPNVGRLNKAGEAIFYGCIYFDDEQCGINVALAETNSLKFDKVNLLRSVSTQELNVRMIGVWDYIKRENKPYYCNQDVFDSFKDIYKYTKQRYKPELFMACQLCDAFFADIMSKESSDRLYDVTSVLGSMFMEGENVDGIIYNSVQAKDSPVIALKPQAVDNKIEHKTALSLEVLDDYGYAIYNAATLYSGEVKGANISWQKS